MASDTRPVAVWGAKPSRSVIALLHLFPAIALGIAATQLATPEPFLLGVLTLLLAGPLLLRAVQRRFDLFDPLSVFCLVLLLIFVFRPILLLLTGTGTFREVYEIGSLVVGYALFLSAVGASLFVLYIQGSGGISDLSVILSPSRAAGDVFARESSSYYLSSSPLLLTPAALLLVAAAAITRRRASLVFAGLILVVFTYVYARMGLRFQVLLSVYWQQRLRRDAADPRTPDPAPIVG